jgi:ABC-2 type transport system permease protein
MKFLNENLREKLKMLKDLTIANIKMFFRDKGALFWSLFFPFLIIGIFGVLDFGGGAAGTIGLVYDEDTEAYAQQVKKAFEEEDGFKVAIGSLDEELDELKNDSRIAVFEFKKADTTELEEGSLEVEKNQSQNNSGDSAESTESTQSEGETEATDQQTPQSNISRQQKIQIKSYIGKENENTGNTISLIVEKMLSDISLKQQKIQLPYEFESEVVNTNELRNIDFIVPGVIAMSIMQGSLFGVIGAIVVNREKGVLKRLFATPLPKEVFLISNIINRTIISLLQICILLGFSYLIFRIKIVGSLGLVFLIAILGSLVFLALAILISGLAKTSETARSMIAPVQMIFMFTGGVYFPREVLPQWLFDITKPLPFTYLADGLRDVMVKGYDLSNSAVRESMLALLIWLVILTVISVKTFKWNGK